MAIGAGCAEDAEVETQDGWWSVSGLSEGTLTLTETESGESWTIDANRSDTPSVVIDGGLGTRPVTEDAGFGFMMLLVVETSEGWTVANGPKPQSRGLDLDIPRVSETYRFTLEVGGAEEMTCELSNESGTWGERSSYFPLYVLASCGVPVSTVEIPDPGLASCIASQVAFGVNTRDVRELDCSNQGIEDLTGLDWLHALASLDISHNSLDTLDSIDWRVLTRLSDLDASHNALTEIDFGSFANVWGEFDFSHNEIALAQNAWTIHPIRLSLRHNQLEEFDVIDPYEEGGGATFQTLDLGYNRLTRLELPRQEELPRVINVERNELEVLDLRSDVADSYFERPMSRLDAAFNRLTAAPADDPSRRRLELPTIGVEEIDLSYNAFTEIPAEYVTAVTQELSGRGNVIETIDLSAADTLDRLDLSENALATIDLSGAPLLRHLDVADNALDDFDWVGGESQLQEIDVSGNPLAAMDDCAAPDLWRLAAEDAGLASLDLSSCPSIEVVELAGNALSALDVSANPALAEIDLRDNPLTCTAVTHIETTLPEAELLHGPDACVP